MVSAITGDAEDINLSKVDSILCIRPMQVGFNSNVIGTRTAKYVL